MSQGTTSSTGKICSSKDHGKHMCVLQNQELQACIDSLADRPLFECRRCGAKANQGRNLCYPSSLGLAGLETLR